MTRLICHRFRSNDVALWLGARMKPGKPVAAVGATEEDREPAADQFAAAGWSNTRGTG
jgi:hypothetical protein